MSSLWLLLGNSKLIVAMVKDLEYGMALQAGKIT